MCIRDRGITMPMKNPPHPGRGLKADFDELGLTTAQAADAPVSYTHLRAHETVLDLVCRLLLEKKNKINTTNHTRIS